MQRISVFASPHLCVFALKREEIAFIWLNWRIEPIFWIFRTPYALMFVSYAEL